MAALKPPSWMGLSHFSIASFILEPAHLVALHDRCHFADGEPHSRRFKRSGSRRTTEVVCAEKR